MPLVFELSVPNKPTAECFLKTRAAADELSQKSAAQRELHRENRAFFFFKLMMMFDWYKKSLGLGGWG